jgi:hypothetical protein
MGCCEDNILDEVYVPLNKRLINYGIECSDELFLKKFPRTHMWIFTFYNNEDLCIECEEKFAKMAKWFVKYGLLEDLAKHVKWIVDDEIKNNLILKDLGIEKTPVHLFCDSNGKIIDTAFGFPDPNWLQKYILPLIRTDVI